MLALLDVAAVARMPTPGQMPAPEHLAPVDRPIRRELSLQVGEATLAAELMLPKNPTGLVVFADGDGLSRASLRNSKLATPLNQVGLVTLLVDLLTEREHNRRRSPERDRPQLASRLEEVTRWAIADPEIGALPIGYLAASAGAAAALPAAVAIGDAVHSIVSPDGRPDLAGGDLARVTAPVLLLAGSRDPEALEHAREAATLLHGPHRVTVVDGAGRLFAEPGTLETAARLSAEWFVEHLATTAEPLVAGSKRPTPSHGLTRSPSQP